MAKSKPRKPLPKSRPRSASRSGAKPSRRRPPPAATGLRSIESILAAFAHDVRTPLTGILALGELLATSELNERERRWVNALRDTAEHLASLTTLVVDGAKAEASGLVLREETFDLPRLARTAAGLFSARAEAKGLICETNIAADLPEHVVGDAIRLRTAIENLLDNAVKFTERGTVALDIRAERLTRDRTRLCVAVTDSGIGLTPTEIKRLFRPFEQASADIAQRFGGAGLGLVLVKRLAKLMDGDLTVESRPDRGSTFSLTAMLRTRAAGAGLKIMSEAQGAPAASAGLVLRILCVEDNPYGRVVMNTILSELGHRVDFVGSGEAAVEAVAEGKHDIVLMDVHLSGLDGLQATRHIRALAGAAAGIPIIGISGRSEAGDEAAAREAGMNAYLRKPVSPLVLARTLGALAGAAGRKPG